MVIIDSFLSYRTDTRQQYANRREGKAQRDCSLQSQWVLSAYTDQTGNSSKAAYSQMQIAHSHDAQQAKVNTPTVLAPPPTNGNHPDRAKFERNATWNTMNTSHRYTCLSENFTASQSVLDALESMRFH
ncbi:hypothetical protein AUP87_22135 [Escherichia coli]|nr:hypothetical protein AUP87_22135 [Escherichia coli]